jgi:DNA-binding SARP family transcriptional activator
LGPVEVVGDDGAVPLPPRVLDLVAVLACRPNTVVPAAQLVDALWPSGPPPTSAKSLQVRVHELRQALGDPKRVGYQQQGYVLALGAGQLDAAEFERLMERGRAAVAARQVGEGAALIRDALALWRGPAFAGRDRIAPVRQEAARLEELRWQAIEELAEADLTLGRHAGILSDLRRRAAEQPFREHLQGLLMVALYRLGRHADALAVFRGVRDRMVEELGVEPGRHLSDLHRAILVRDPALDLPAHPGTFAVPVELPADVPTFAGRDGEIQQLVSTLTTGEGRLVVAAISGTGGAGKSALAVHVAHAVAAQFPDGQLFASLHGAAAGVAPLAPAVVLNRFLRALGMPDPPADVDEAAARFRSLTAGRRMLVVLDDAADEAQVRPLFPGAGGSAVVVTSRRVLSALDGVTHLRLGTLTEWDAMDLLGRLAGADRVGGDHEAAAAIARFCGHLPLALRVCGARLVAHPQQTLASFAGQLSDARYRLDRLQHGDLAVRASIAASRRDLDARPGGARALRVLELVALLETPDVTAPVAAALAGGGVEEAQVALDQLTEAQLLEEPAPGRYGLHDLVRLYAREQAVTEIPEPERIAALRRAFDHYAGLGRLGTELLDPGQARWLRDGEGEPAPGAALGSEAEVIAWLDAEHVNAVAAIRQAATLPGAEAAAAIRLAAALSTLLDRRGYWQEWIVANEAAARVAQRIGDRVGRARALMFLGNCVGRIGRLAEELRYVEAALALWRDIGDPFGESGALNACGWAYLHQRRHREALACFERGLLLRQETGDRHGEVMLLGNLGTAYREMGRIDEALDCYQRAARVSRRLDDAIAQAHATTNLAHAHSRAGDHELAVRDFAHSLLLHQKTGDRHHEAATLWGLGTALHELGHHDRARDRWCEALEILHDTGLLTAEQVVDILRSPVPDTPKAIELILA